MTRTLILALAVAASTPALAQSAAPGRGQLLYSNHCVECHTTRMHWREKRLAQDWTTLKALVWHWQAVSRLQWTPEDVEAVARHLNETYYKLPEPPVAQR